MFSSESDLCLPKSSNKSLIALIDITNNKGNNIAGYPPDIEIGGITYKTRMNKKYTLAILENCSNKFLGMKVYLVYFDVIILFILNLTSVKFVSLALNVQNCEVASTSWTSLYSKF